jgi:hypothetical protein
MTIQSNIYILRVTVRIFPFPSLRVGVVDFCHIYRLADQTDADGFGCHDK